MSDIKKIHFHGIIGEKFGKCFNLAVNTPLEALKAIAYQIKGFREEFEKYDYQVVKGSLQKGWLLDEETVDISIANDEIHFIPHIAGSGGGGGIGKLITGVVLVGLAFTGVGAAFAGALGFSTTQLAVMGGVLALGGIAQMRAKTPKMNFTNMEPADRRASFVFRGAENTTEQGNAIPLVYGRLRVGSQVVAQGMDTVNI